MTQLFSYKWEKAQGKAMIQSNGSQPVYSDNFKLWMKKTENLSNRQWKRAFDKLEARVEKDAAQGKESWAPSYPKFVGLASENMCPDGKNSEAYRIVPPKERLLEDITQKDHKHEVGQNALNAMKDLF